MGVERGALGVERWTEQTGCDRRAWGEAAQMEPRRPIRGSAGWRPQSIYSL